MVKLNKARSLHHYHHNYHHNYSYNHNYNYDYNYNYHYRTETLNGMVSHVKLGHPNSIMCWVCGMGWSTQEGKVRF